MNIISIFGLCFDHCIVCPSSFMASDCHFDMFKLCKNVKLVFFFFIQLVQLFMIKVLRYCLVADFLYIYSIFLKTLIFLYKFYFIILCASCTLQHFFFQNKTDTFTCLLRDDLLSTRITNDQLWQDI